MPKILLFYIKWQAADHKMQYVKHEM